MNKVEMTDAELLDFAIQIVKDFGEINIVSTNNSVNAIPNIWFTDKDNKLSWIVVKHCIYPMKEAVLNIDINNLPAELLGHNGYFASVGFCPVEFAKIDENNVKMYRGEGAYSNFSGLKIIHQAS